MGKILRLFNNTDKIYIFLSTILAIAVLSVCITRRQGPLVELYDYWEHAACVTELSSNLINPGNPLLNSAEPDTLRYTPYILVMALCKRIFHLDLITVITLFSFISLVFFAGGIYLWSCEYFRDKKIPVYVLAALICLWGLPFDYSNEYSMRFFSYTVFYPSIFTFNLGFTGLYLLLRCIRYKQPGMYVLYFLCAAFIFISHPLTGSFFLLCSFITVLTESEKKTIPVLLFFICTTLILFMSFIWPYFSFENAVVNSVNTDWYYPFRMYLYDPANIYKIGPALLGLPVIFAFILNRKYCFITLGFTLCCTIYLTSYFLNIRLGERYIFFIIFFLHISAAWYFRKLNLLSYESISESLLNSTGINLHKFIFLATLVACFAYQSLNLGFEQAGYCINFRPQPALTKYKNPVDDYLVLKDKLCAGDTVLSDPLTSWLLPAITGAKIICLYHNNPMVSDNNIRTQDVIKLYNSSIPLKEKIKIIEKYKATHILLNIDRMKDCRVNRINNYYMDFKFDNKIIDECKKMGRVIFNNKTFILIKTDVNA